MPTWARIAVNLSSLYLEMWDLPAATAPPKKACAKTGCWPSACAARRLLQAALAGATRTNSQRCSATVRPTLFSPRESRRRGLAGRLCAGSDGVGSAGRGASRRGTAAGSRKQRFSKPSDCGDSFVPADLGWSYGHLGALALARHDFRTAERFTQLALDARKARRTGVAGVFIAPAGGPHPPGARRG